MRRAEYIPSARSDLRNLRLYLTTASGSRDASRKFIARLRAYCDHLASLPFLMGKDRSDLRANLRSATFEAYMIFFRYIEDRFEVVNIVEGHRDIPAYFSPANPE